MIGLVKADQTYINRMTPTFVDQVLEESLDTIRPTMGGQTTLNGVIANPIVASNMQFPTNNTHRLEPVVRTAEDRLDEIVYDAIGGDSLLNLGGCGSEKGFKSMVKGFAPVGSAGDTGITV
ncbi:hypothetical protein SUGI_0150040 [Cryptomeria japonica]|nr:hypothetical protein SUGI_0150040 [Cryptomeria japonica]